MQATPASSASESGRSRWASACSIARAMRASTPRVEGAPSEPAASRSPRATTATASPSTKSGSTSSPRRCSTSRREGAATSGSWRQKTNSPVTRRAPQRLVGQRVEPQGIDLDDGLPARVHAAQAQVRPGRLPAQAVGLHGLARVAGPADAHEVGGHRDRYDVEHVPLELHGELHRPGRQGHGADAGHRALVREPRRAPHGRAVRRHGERRPAPRAFLAHRAASARQAPGVRPVWRRNTAPKWLCEANPVAKATSARGMRGSASMACARATRRAVT